MIRTMILFLMTLLFSTLPIHSINPMPPTSFHQGRHHLKQKQYTSALSSFLSAQQQQPTFAGSYIGEGMVHIKLGAIRKAATAFNRAATLDPNDSSAWHNAATSYNDLGAFKEAEHAYKRSLLLKMYKQLNQVSCTYQDRNGSMNHGWIISTTFFETNRNNVSILYLNDQEIEMETQIEMKTQIEMETQIETEIETMTTTTRIQTTQPFLAILSNIVLIDTLMVEKNACTIHTGRHSLLRTVPRNLGKQLSFPSKNAIIQFNETPVFSILQSTSPTNMYHWMCESMVRLILYLNYIKRNETTSIKIILIPKKRNEMIDATLSMLGIFTNKQFIVHRYQRDQTYHISTLEWIDWDYDYSIGGTFGPGSSEIKENNLNQIKIQWMSLSSSFNTSRPPTSVYYAPSFSLRLVSRQFQELLKLVPVVPTSHTISNPTLLWVSRRQAKTRHITNEKDIWNQMSATTSLSLSLPLTIHDGTSSFSDQIKMFQRAKVIIGPHGAGMTLIMFATSTASIMMFPLINEVGLDGYYHHIANAMQINFQTDSLLAMNRNLNMTFNQTQKDFIVEFVVDGVVK